MSPAGKKAFTLSTLQRIRSLNKKFGLPPGYKDPPVENFRQTRKTFHIDMQKAFSAAGNGLQQKVVIDRTIELEADFFIWQASVGKLGDPGTSRAEHMVYRSFERAGWRFPTSTPPGFDVEYLARVGGNAGGIELDFYIRERNIAIRINGEYWHYKDDIVTNQGIVERAILEAQGMTVVDILAQDTKTEARTDYVVGLAMNGHECDISGRLGIFR